MSELHFYYLLSLKFGGYVARDAVSYERPLLSDSVSVSVCLSAARLEPIDNVRATLQSLQRREPRRLPASMM